MKKGTCTCVKGKKHVINNLSGFSLLVVCLFISCSRNTYINLSSPEETGLNLAKLTDENSQSIEVGAVGILNPGMDYVNTIVAFNKQSNYRWFPGTYLSISPDGTQIAYLSRDNKKDNIVVRSIGSSGAATQRTFRNVGEFYWGADEQLYFSDENKYICSVDARMGSIMRQHTSGNVNDRFPVLSSDGSIIFFTRENSTYGPSIWALNKNDGTLSSCARGYNPCPIPKNNDAFYCVRNSASGRSEIWHVDYKNGKESVILSDEKRSYSNPSLSPDGKWLLVVGNTVSSISKRQNLDIFVVRTDGTQLTQMTYHPENDSCPVWSKDGKYIYFISSRGNEKREENIWRMTFPL